MEPTIHTAMIEPVGGHCGMHYYDFSLCRGLLAAGCQVSLYTCDETAPPAIPGLRFYPVYRQVFGRGSRWIRACRYLRGTVGALARALIGRQKICHLHLFQGEKEELSLVLLARLCGRRVIITVHDIEAFAPVATSHSAILKVYGLAEAFIVHNCVSMKELQSLGIPSSRIRVIPHGHYLETMREMPPQAEARRALGIAESARVVLFFGQIKDVKGLDILIQAMPAIAIEVADVTFLIAGRPLRTDFSTYEELIDRLGVRARCRLHIGFVPDDEVAKYYAAADVVVLPYRRIYQSGVLLMAMSYGRPAVVSDLPGMTEMITDGHNGYVFTQGSKDALAATLIRVLQDDQGRARAAARGLEYIRQHHDWEKIGKTTSELYRSVLRR